MGASHESRSSSTTNLWDESYGQIGAFLKRMSDRGVSPDALNAIRSNDVLADTLATLMKRLTDEYFIIRTFSRAITVNNDLYEGLVILQHYGVGRTPKEMTIPGAVAVCDLHVLDMIVSDPFWGVTGTTEQIIRRFQNSHHPEVLELATLCAAYRDDWGNSDGIEFLCPIYVPEKISGIRQINPRLRVLKSAFYSEMHIVPKLTVD